jgi:hypothetical protein
MHLSHHVYTMEGMTMRYRPDPIPPKEGAAETGTFNGAAFSKTENKSKGSAVHLQAQAYDAFLHIRHPVLEILTKLYHQHTRGTYGTVQTKL